MILAMSVLTTDRIFQASDLRRDREFIDEARQHGAARLRDTDGASFVMVKEADYGRLATEHDSSQELLQVARALLVIAAAMHRGEEIAPLLPASPWPWLSAFDAEDILEFVRELADETAQGVSYGDPEGVRRQLAAWRESARAMSDPERRAALTDAIVPAELTEIAPG
jgi:hypothetical protein